MKVNGFDFDDNTRAALSGLPRAGRLPHALLLECPDADRAAQAAVLLSMFAVCSGDGEHPCGVCKNCRNAREKAHPDVTWLPLLPQKKQYAISQIRDMIRDASVLPNEADAKVYILENCDERLASRPEAQNAFLKLAEEPPPNVYFMLLCRSAQSLLPTILSRFTVVRLRSEAVYDEAARRAAEDIARGILDSNEYPLLKACRALTDKACADGALAALRLHLRDALVLLSGGKPLGDSETARLLAARLTRQKLLDLLALCDSAGVNIKQNVNMNLLGTWVCGECRRITWQR